ncbi:MAG: TonB-dependent receptor [Sphingobacteriales bacterium 17-39-43]|uniref:TonB-dependent receptor family protein n=1 Tax=Daejeonella sp. TaxID=2805397 RepID=UPI000BCE1D8D|nr:TonB-dependent receptor [Daejeonella sp.]OYZ31126.1 MAG: TonB-dependent receptor [Sphingobacteriales bacterium 16-39-50]OZA23967.1 MAG: TonB-dependent receptor [Sphingobacteriales bacterium 17-39-43]HQT23277.1 TonB-dependent receptor [Daejeonella sp.]HQT58229.1 TonB-dependent receptor [Daejeonella sp.]
MTKKSLLVFGLFLTISTAFGQAKSDTIKSKILDPITVQGILERNGLSRLEPIVGTYIFTGKKNEVISVTQMDANLTDKTGRQIFAKVPGVFVYDMDGSGNQINISTRGLDPHRGWEFNIRKDGVLTNSDMYGYPASHYSMPLESIERIELVRGTGSLQYGSQFGGMLNYVSKQGDTTKSIHFESYNTVGSFNLLSSYNAIGGKIGKIKYYAYISKRSRDGYRRNEHTDYDAQSIMITYEANRNLSLRMEWARSNYVYRIPGPLTEAMYNTDPRQATRSRNYFNPAINIPSFLLKWNILDKTKLQYTSSAVIGNRNSVMFDKPATIKDTINTTTGQYNSRQVDIDNFNSYTNELRLLRQYRLGKQESSLAMGVQLMNNDLHRTQQGKGTTGSDFDLTLVNPQWGRDIHFKTQNVALFAENSFKLLKNLSANIGARLESGESKMLGNITYLPIDRIPFNLKHRFVLLGSSVSYRPTSFIDIYAGWSQTYRPMIFKDLVPTEIYEKVDPNLKDAEGYNAELGFRGNWKFLKWDITGFLLQYNNRFGTIAQTDANNQLYTYRTNIGNSLTKGFEIFIQGNWTLNNKTELSIFTSTAIMDGKYTSGSIKSGTANISVDGNKIESVPGIISRNGLTFRFRKFSLSGLYSFTGESFADALNTVIPTANGSIGLVPSYGIFDLNTTIKISEKFEIKGGLNNLTDKQYFTKRPLFYPGPGIWTSDGRNGTISFIVRI